MFFALKYYRHPAPEGTTGLPLNQAVIMPSVRADGQSGKVKKLRIKTAVL